MEIGEGRKGGRDERKDSVGEIVFRMCCTFLFCFRWTFLLILQFRKKLVPEAGPKNFFSFRTPRLNYSEGDNNFETNKKNPFFFSSNRNRHIQKNTKKRKRNSNSIVQMSKEPLTEGNRSIVNNSTTIWKARTEIDLLLKKHEI